jgi:hypothetical protein
MIELRVLSGQRNGFSLISSKLPCSIGRSPDSDLRLEANGVFDEHAVFSLADDGDIQLSSRPPARTSVNGQTTANAVLRNGDIIDLGGVKVEFGFQAALQKEFGSREMFTWCFLLGITIAQALIIFWLNFG